ncbi:MAG: HD domain-containing protein [Deltaproteobacteria bacterium]|nr:HD domain-containing protein [Deltaproteobacteria bacterium]
MSRLSEFLFEAAFLKRTPRTGYQFLGTGRESVAEHSFGAAAIAYVLARMANDKPGGRADGRPGDRADAARAVMLALFHDLAEARTGDLNYVNKQFCLADERAAFAAAAKDLPFEAELLDNQAEWLAGETLEAKLAADADQLDMIMELWRLLSQGWKPAGDWLAYAVRRLKTDEGRELLRQITESSPDDWWFERRDELWVNPKNPPAAGENTGPAGGDTGPADENIGPAGGDTGPADKNIGPAGVKAGPASVKSGPAAGRGGRKP